MSWELQSIKARHKLIIDLHLAGLTNVKIAEEMDCTDVSVGMILRSPIVQQEIARRRTTVDRKVDQAVLDVVTRAKAILDGATEKAALTLVGQMESSSDERVQQNAALSILERTFGKGDQNPKTVVNISVEQLAILTNALNESRSHVGELPV